MQFSIFSEREKWLQGVLEGEPITYDESSQTWNVCQYADVKHILSHSATFSSQGFDTMKHPISWSFAMKDGKAHEKLRSLVAHKFSAEEVKSLQSYIITTANNLLDTITANEQCNLATDFANPLAAIMAAKIIGLPIEDHLLIKHWADEQGEQFADAHAALPTEVIAYFEQAIQTRRAQRQQDIINHLLDAKFDDRPLTREELLGFLFLLLVAAVKSVYATLTTTLLLMLEHPNITAKLRTNFSLFPKLLEEVVRFYPAQGRLLRRPTTDVVINGQHIACGEPVVLWVNAANLDARQIDQPCQFNGTREPNRHLGWGHGPHFCIGRHLALLEIRLAVEVLLTRFSTMSLDPDRPVEFNERGELQSLPIRLTVA